MLHPRVFIWSNKGYKETNTFYIRLYISWWLKVGLEFENLVWPVLVCYMVVVVSGDLSLAALLFLTLSSITRKFLLSSFQALCPVCPSLLPVCLTFRVSERKSSQVAQQTISHVASLSVYFHLYTYVPALLCFFLLLVNKQTQCAGSERNNAQEWVCRV